MKKVVVGGIYKHRKGHIYKVLGVAKHSETLEELVVYVNTQNPDEVWVRPKIMFLENVVVEGKKVPRFTLISKK